MDRLVIERKLESLQRCIGRIRDRIPADYLLFADDMDSQDIVVLNLSRAVQLCVDIGAHCLGTLTVPPPNTMGETFDRLAEGGVIEQALAERLKKSVGFRNIAVHNYSTLDMNIVHAIATRHLDDFRLFARAVAGFL